MELIGGDKVALKHLLKPNTKTAETFMRKMIKEGDTVNDGQMDLYTIKNFPDLTFLSVSLKTLKQYENAKIDRS